MIFNVIIPKKKLYKQKKLIHNIVFIYWDISNMSDLFFIKKNNNNKKNKKKIGAKTQVMNETISS